MRGEHAIPLAVRAEEEERGGGERDSSSVSMRSPTKEHGIIDGCSPISLSMRFFSRLASSRGDRLLSASCGDGPPRSFALLLLFATRPGLGPAAAAAALLERSCLDGTSRYWHGCSKLARSSSLTLPLVTSVFLLDDHALAHCPPVCCPVSRRDWRACFRIG